MEPSLSPSPLSRFGALRHVLPPLSHTGYIRIDDEPTSGWVRALISTRGQSQDREGPILNLFFFPTPDRSDIYRRCFVGVVFVQDSQDTKTPRHLVMI
jgi:hypothetical protein